MAGIEQNGIIEKQLMENIEFLIERLILRNGNLANNNRDHDLKSGNLTSAQSETILYYAEHRGDSIKALALHLSISHQAARKLVEKLREKGMLDILISKDDRRYTSIYLTADGEELHQELKNKGFSAGEKMLEGFSDGEKTVLLDYLERIKRYLEKRTKNL